MFETLLTLHTALKVQVHLLPLPPAGSGAQSPWRLGEALSFPLRTSAFAAAVPRVACVDATVYDEANVPTWASQACSAFRAVLGSS